MDPVIDLAAAARCRRRRMTIWADCLEACTASSMRNCRRRLPPTVSARMLNRRLRAAASRCLQSWQKCADL